jgi:excisionase family DNA binding protein
MTPENTRGERLLTIQEVSEWTGLAVGTLYHFVSEQRIPVVRLSKRCIRFRYSDLVLWISSLTQNSNRSNSDEKKK